MDERIIIALDDALLYYKKMYQETKISYYKEQINFLEKFLQKIKNDA